MTSIQPIFRALSTAALAVAALALHAPASHAASLAVELACASDYYAYCSAYDPDGAAVRSCFRANGSKLSKRCVNALMSAGEVGKDEVDRKTAAAGR